MGRVAPSFRLLVLLCWTLSFAAKAADEATGPTEKKDCPYHELKTKPRRTSSAPAKTTLPEPVPLNTLYEIHSVSHPRGKSNGALYHVRPKDHVDHLRALEGSNFVPAHTEFSEAPEFYTALGFRATSDARIGEYWSEIPSAELMQSNIERWNQSVNGDPLKTVYLKYKTAGAHLQMEMARLASEGHRGMGEPLRVYTEPYAVTNSAPPKPSDHNQLVLNPATGRVEESQGLFFHDVGQMANSVYVDKKTSDHISDVSRFYVELFELFKGKDLRIDNQEAKEVRAIILKHDPGGQSPIDANKPGLATSRYISLMALHSQSSYHGYEHMLGWLVRNRQGLDPATFNEGTRGTTFQREALFHLMRLGVRKPGSQPFFKSHVGFLTYREASETGNPLTLERAIEFIHNRDNVRAQTLLRDLQESYRENSEISPQLQAIAARYERLLGSRLSPEQIQAVADETRARYRALGGVP